MANLKKILALVLVMAMTFTMLPVFAAADDVAVETVAPVAEAPAAEAPAAPAIAPAAVEDVAVIPEAAPAEAPTAAPVEAIETAPTEAVKAELQAVSDSDIAKVVVYDSGNNVVSETGYSTLLAACNAAGKLAAGTVCNVVLLKDATYVPTKSSYGTNNNGAGATGVIGAKANYLTWNTPNTTDAEITVNGFWLDLNGHTYTVNCEANYAPATYSNQSVPINIKNGTLIYDYNRSTAAEQFGVVMCGYHSSSTNFCAIGTEDELYVSPITIKDANLYRVDSYGGPVLAVSTLSSEITIIRSTLVSTSGNAIQYWKNRYSQTAPAGIDTATHNLTIKDSRLGSAANKTVISCKTVSPAGGLILPNNYVNITTQGGVQFYGSSYLNVESGGPTVNFAGEASLTTASTKLTLPDTSTLSASSAANAVPSYLAPVERSTWLYRDAAHTVHGYEHFAEVPATQTATGFAEHYQCKYCGDYFEADDPVNPTPTTRDALVIPLLCTHEAKAFVAEVSPTYTATGFAAHYYCSGCGTYWEDDGTTETTADALILPIAPCPHAPIEGTAAVASTFSTQGNSAYWYCSDCLKYFSDAEGNTQIAENSWVLPKRTDATGLSDSEILTLGGEAKVVFADSSVNAYDTLRAAYLAAAASTQLSEVTLLKNVVIYETRGSNAHTVNGTINGTTGTRANYKTWNVENSSDATVTVNGFWLDLGGHTLTLNSYRSAFCVDDSVPLNIKNGKIVHGLNYNAGINSKGVISMGYSDDAVGSTANGYNYNPTITLKDLEVYRLYSDTSPLFYNGPVIFSAYFASTINLYDCTIIGQRGAAIRYTKGPTTKGVAEGAVYEHTINVYGASKIGTVCATNDAYGAAIYAATVTPATNIPTTGNTVELNVYGDSAVFYGKAGLAVPASGGPLMIVNALTTEGTAAVSYPTVASFAALEAGTESVPAFADVENVVSYAAVAHTHDKVHVDAVAATATSIGVAEHYHCDGCGQYWEADGTTPTTLAALQIAKLDAKATFTPNGGDESAAMTVAEAYQAWVANSYSGTIKLLDDIENENETRIYGVIGGTNTLCYQSGGTASFYPMFCITSAACGGDLTLDLNGHSVVGEKPFLGATADVVGFELNVLNGTVETQASRPVVTLAGQSFIFRMDNVTLFNSTGNSYANTIMDARYGGSYAILTNCVIKSNQRAALAPYTTVNNVGDDTLLYYVKDCSFSNEGSTSQAAVYGLNNQSTFNHFTMIVDGDSSFRFIGETVLNLRNNDDINCLAARTNGTTTIGETTYYSVTTDSSNSKLTTAGEAAATLTFGTELTLYFKNVSDAVEFAEIFGRNGLATTLTLNEDAVISESAAIGNAGCASAFTLDLNGRTITDDGQVGLMEIQGGADTVVNVTVTGAFGDAATSAKFFAGIPALDYASGNSYIAEKGFFFSDYSLNLEDSVTINLYTGTANGDPDYVSYLQDGTTYTVAAKDAANAWVVDTLAAKQMEETIDAYAVKADGTTTYIDFSKGVSVKGYVESDPAASQTDPTVVATLNETLKAMQVYGAYAAKFFSGDNDALTGEELTALIGTDTAPATYVDGLDDSAFAITGIGNHAVDSSVNEGYYGSAAVLADKLSLKFYFYGDQFADNATVTIGGETTNFTPQASVDGAFKYVEASVAAKDFDTAITVAFEGIGSVTDSISAYTKRLIDSGNSAANLASALRSYGAAAKAYSDAKTAATP